MPGKSQAYWRTQWDKSHGVATETNHMRDKKHYWQTEASSPLTNTQVDFLIHKFGEGIQPQQKEAWKALHLLAQYANFYRELPLTKYPYAWGGAMRRFLNGNWNRHHCKAVEVAIRPFFKQKDHVLALNKKFHRVEFILAIVKEAISNSLIRTDGDLHRILQTINEKTGVNYFTLNSAEVLKKYKPYSLALD